MALDAVADDGTAEAADSCIKAARAVPPVPPIEINDNAAAAAEAARMAEPRRETMMVWRIGWDWCWGDGLKGGVGRGFV